MPTDDTYPAQSQFMLCESKIDLSSHRENATLKSDVVRAAMTTKDGAKQSIDACRPDGKQQYLVTAGGGIICRRCNATSKRTRLQCGAPAMHGKTKCKTHGGMSTGPITDEGKLRCAQAITIHGLDTHASRQVNRLEMKRLRLYAQILGLPFRSDAGDKRL